MHHLRDTIRRVCTTWVPCLATVLVLFHACALDARAAVTLAYFRATGLEDHVFVEWETGSEIDHAGFTLHRDVVGNVVHTVGIRIDCFYGCSYSFEDYDVEPGTTYYYWLESLNLGGGSQIHGPVEATPGATPTPTWTSTPTSSPTSTPTSTPTATPTFAPTSTPTATPSFTPTSTPTSAPTRTPAPPPDPPAILSFQADPPSIPVGACTRLSWAVEGSIGSVWLEGEGVGDHDSRDRCPEGTTVYALRAVGPGGENTATVHVLVVPLPPTPSLAPATPTSTATAAYSSGLTVSPTSEAPRSPSAPETSEGTATPTATPGSATIIAAAPALPAEPARRIAAPGAATESMPDVARTALSITTILPCVSGACFLGVLLLAIALSVVRKSHL